jgi:hypothetical protein
MLRHYVTIKYIVDTPPEHIAVFCEKMRALQNIIPEVAFLEIGRDELKTERSWSLILIMKFDTTAALKNYQQHPQHQAVMSFNGPYVADVGSIDFTDYQSH